MRYRSPSLIAFFPFFVICLFFPEYLTTSISLYRVKIEREKETVLNQNGVFKIIFQTTLILNFIMSVKAGVYRFLQYNWLQLCFQSTPRFLKKNRNMWPETDLGWSSENADISQCGKSLLSFLCHYLCNTSVLFYFSFCSISLTWQQNKWNVVNAMCPINSRQFIKEGNINSLLA